MMTAMVVMRRVMRAESSKGRRPGRPRRSGISALGILSVFVVITKACCYTITQIGASPICENFPVYFVVAAPQ